MTIKEQSAEIKYLGVFSCPIATFEYGGSPRAKSASCGPIGLKCVMRTYRAKSASCGPIGLKVRHVDAQISSFVIK